MTNIIIKNAEQIDGIRKSCRLAAQCLKFIAPYVQAGVTTASLDAKIEGFTRDHGATSAPLNYVLPSVPVPFPKSTCISLNEEVCHGIPSEKVILKEGDILNIDVTTILNGYYGDTSTMFVVPPISKDASDLLAITNKCLHLGISEVYPGNRFGNIGYAITKYANLQKASVVYQLTGHGTGFFFHEEPQVQHYITEKDIGPVMKAGYIFTVEPMLNLGVPDCVVDQDMWTIRTADGSLSAQYEHTLLCTDTGVEILTLPSITPPTRGGAC